MRGRPQIGNVRVVGRPKPVRPIVDSHEGQIEVRSDKGVGTTFMIILPRVEAEV